jgi:uncharacterized protein (TIGR00297 family)
MDPQTAFSNALRIGLPLALVIAFWAHQRDRLSAGGGVAAVLVGVAVFAGGPITTAALLVFFFSAVLLDRWSRPRSPVTSLTKEQSGPRQATQVFAVGLIPALASLAYTQTENPRWLVVALAALAFAAADTWATDIGQTAKREPRILGWGRRVVTGFSGGVTLRGTVAALAGALTLGLVGAIGYRALGGMGVLIITASGFATSLLDSLFGATIQTRLRCAVCGQPTERTRHCQTRAHRTGGFLSNSGVNLVCSAVAALLAWTLYA